MSLVLRSYQKECIDTIQSSFKESPRQLIQLPTGSGKTVVFWEYISKNCKSALIVVPSVQLAEQVKEQSKLFIHPSQLSLQVGNYKAKIIRPYHIMSSSGIIRPANIEKLNQHEFDVLVIDEAHKAAAECTQKALSKLTCFKRILGVTATPYRHDQKNLLEVFEKLSYSKKIMELVQQDFLCDLKGIRIATGCSLVNDSKSDDFSTVSLYKQLANEERDTLILNTYEKFCKKRKTLIFCLNIQHSEEMAELIRGRGYKGQAIHGKMSFEERKQILKDFKEGRFDFLTNAQLLTEGFDEPSVDALILARPTMSRVLYMQMIGRGTRLFRGKKECLVIDLADSYKRVCTYLSIPFPDEDLSRTNKPHQDLISLKEIAENPEFFRGMLDALHAEEFSFVEIEGRSILDEPVPEYIACPFPQWTTWKEALFLRWKEKLKREFYKHGIH